MVDNTQSGMPCSEFDALLMEAVEGKLTAAQSERFRSHADSCGVCGPLFADAKSGFAWLQSLEEVEPPANLLHNILAATSERDAANTKVSTAKLSFADRFRAGIASADISLISPDRGQGGASRQAAHGAEVGSALGGLGGLLAGRGAFAIPGILMSLTIAS